MADHLSDQAQLDALKKWWRSYGVNLLLVVAIGLGGWYGWNFWQDRNKDQAHEASIIFMAMLDAVSVWDQNGSEESAAQVSAHAETLKKIAPSSQYARYGALTIARLALAEEDYDNAAAELGWVLDEAEDDAMKALVRLRLAGVEFARKNNEKALELLDASHPAPFVALYAELKGDILAAQGDNGAARQAYQVALDALNDGDMQVQALLELKINEITPVADNGTVSGEGEA